ncbi:hypothetical protein [Hymenobacter koreensis]|uniref:Uncharacterized protein n=1 Tax=Hymenobacter koreensis TaxID=1084523 RepID=A0ABP8JJE4_9BACT
MKTVIELDYKEVSAAISAYVRNKGYDVQVVRLVLPEGAEKTSVGARVEATPRSTYSSTSSLANQTARVESQGNDR